MRGLPSGIVPAVRQPLAEDKSLLPFFSNERVIRAVGGAGALLTGCCVMSNPASGSWCYHHSEKPLFTVMVPAQWCCAGTATTSCVTRHPNHSSNLLIKTCQHG